MVRMVRDRLYRKSVAVVLSMQVNLERIVAIWIMAAAFACACGWHFRRRPTAERLGEAGRACCPICWWLARLLGRCCWD